MSFSDTMTQIYNRNKFNKLIEEFEEGTRENIGVAYFDLNGLKETNDRYGHEAGDKLIRQAAQNINAVFTKHTYRIGGDEFAVIASDITKEEFETGIQNVCELMNGNRISIALGHSWMEESSNLQEQLKDADQKMYADKERAHMERK